MLWFDAHADFNTPDSTVTGFLDGMALAVVTGDCWSGMVSRAFHGFRPIAKARVVLAGVRDVDPDENRRLVDAGLIVLPSQDAGNRMPAVLRRLRMLASSVYVHVDLDVLDPGEAPANHFAVPGGLSVDGLCGILQDVCRDFRVAGVALTAYDPEVDPQSRMPDAASRILSAVLSGSRC